MSWEWIVKGILLGLSIAAPLGPISIMCINKTLVSGYKTGLFSGLGAATADAIYGSMAGLGLTFLTNFFMEYKVLLQCLGGLFICYLGIKTFLHTPNVHTSEQPAKKSLFHSYSVTFLLTLTNPMTILFFLGVFGASGLIVSQTRWDMSLLVGGVFLGSMLWWAFLISAIAFFRINLINRSMFSLLNKLSGLVLIGFGVSSIIQ